MRIRPLILSLVALAGWLMVSNEASAQPPGFIDLGTITDTVLDYNVPDVQTTVTIASAGQIVWYKFTITEATSAAGRFVDIRTSATSTVDFDSEIGVYNSSGSLVATDDDDGHGLRSALTFGNTTSRTAPLDPFGFTNGLAFNGRDGNLPIGDYFIAVAQFNATFGPSAFNVTTTGTGTGSWTLEFRTDIVSAVPEPTTLAFLGAGLFVSGLAVRRWRKSRTKPRFARL